MKRITSFLKSKKMLGSFKSSPNLAKSSLSIEPAIITSYPEPCPVCKRQQCVFDLRHGMIFAVKDAFEEQLEIYGKGKPPDDESGLLVATIKEP